MGGAAMETTTRGGRRPLDAPVNLVPYVDILMTLMVFLVMCAVFQQLAALTLDSGQGASSSTAAPEEALVVRLDALGALVGDVRIPRSAGHLDLAAVGDALKSAGARDASCRVTAEDGVLYSEIVEVVDLARGLGLRQMSLDAG